MEEGTRIIRMKNQQEIGITVRNGFMAINTLWKNHSSHLKCTVTPRVVRPISSVQHRADKLPSFHYYVSVTPQLDNKHNSLFEFKISFCYLNYNDYFLIVHVVCVLCF